MERYRISSCRMRPGAAMNVSEHPKRALSAGTRNLIGTERFDDAVRHLERGIAVSRATGQGHLSCP